MGSQQFCLRWNNHQTNMLSVFDKLLAKEAFVDVTIACEGSSIKAHKIVLSACSPFFESLFCDNPCKHPIVILRDMRYADLQAIIDFIYKGEINVSQEQLSTLLKAAESLQIKGLAEVTQEDQSLVNKSSSSDFGVKSQPENLQRSFSPQTSIVNHCNSSSVTSSSHKRKNKVRRNSSEVHPESNPPANKRKAESPKLSDSKENSLSAATDLSQLCMVQTSTSQSMLMSEMQNSPQTPSNVAINARDQVKLEVSPPSPSEIISADTSHDLRINEEYILEPDTMNESVLISNRNEKENEQTDNMVTESNVSMDQSLDAGPSQDSSIYYQDGYAKVDDNMNITSIAMRPIRSRHTKRWSEKDMQQAITMITAGGWDIRRTAETYNIPLRTIYYHLKKARQEKVPGTRPRDTFCVQHEV